MKERVYAFVHYCVIFLDWLTLPTKFFPCVGFLKPTCQQSYFPRKNAKKNEKT